ncbi:MAG: hypothetical protein AAF235_05580 [Planctomycetota bacterium]
MSTLAGYIPWVHALATGLMAGLVLFVQVVHYPLFAKVGTAEFPAYETAHQNRTTIIVAPLMLTEALTAALLVLMPTAGVSRTLTITSAVLVAAVWALTFFVAVPLHGKLSSGFDAAAHRALVASNWPRTVLWVARAVIAVAIVAQASVAQVSAGLSRA